MHNESVSTLFTTIGHYHLRDRLGQGGMGIVYRAHDPRLERDVAIKCLRTELIESQYVERFRREALLLAKLNHPHIVQIFDFIETDDQLALVMELIDGQTLSLYVREHLVGLKQRLLWLAQIAEGLAAAHDRGIIHRDLKSDNILIHSDGRAIITDLGIAKSTDFHLTLTDHVTGSFTAMSPEQARGDAVDFKSDLFSLGILAYQLLCGAHPFGETNNKLQTMQRIIASAPTPPQHVNPQLPAAAMALLTQLLDKDPSKRPHSALDVSATFLYIANLLSDALVDEDFTSAFTPPLPGVIKSSQGDHSGVTTRVRKLFTPPSISRKAIGVSCSVAAITVLVALAFHFFGQQPPRYIALLHPQLSAHHLSENEKALVSVATAQALQQTAIELDNYYLIPFSLKDAVSTPEEAQQQLDADEAISSDIQCAQSLCHITISRIIFQGKKPRVLNTKTIILPKDDYIAQSEHVSEELAAFYGTTTATTSPLDTATHHTLLQAQLDYYQQGATEKLLESLLALPLSAKASPLAQTLMRDVVLDLYYDAKNPQLLDQLEQFLGLADSPLRLQHAINRYYFYATKNDVTHREEMITHLKSKGIKGSALAEFEGYAAMMIANYDSAITHFLTASKLRRTANNMFNLANAYWHQGNTAQALSTAIDALAINPNHYKTVSLVGVLNLVNGNVVDAQSAFEQALAYNPDDVVNLNNLALTQLINKRYADAITSFENVHRANPDNHTWLLNLADAYQLHGDNEAANALYQQLIDQHKDSGMTNERLRHLAQSYAHIGDINNALRALQQLEMVDGAHVETRYTAAIVHTRANNIASALLAVDSALKSGMHSVWFELEWFDVLCSHTDFEQIMRSAGAPYRCSPLKQ